MAGKVIHAKGTYVRTYVRTLTLAQDYKESDVLAAICFVASSVEGTGLEVYLTLCAKAK